MALAFHQDDPEGLAYITPLATRTFFLVCQPLRLRGIRWIFRIRGVSGVPYFSSRYFVVGILQIKTAQRINVWKWCFHEQRLPCGIALAQQPFQRRWLRLVLSIRVGNLHTPHERKLGHLGSGHQRLLASHLYQP